MQVGDTVSEGDVICTLDSSDLEEQLAKRQEALDESRETAQKNYDKAVESYNSAAAKQTEAYNAYASAALGAGNGAQHRISERGQFRFGVSERLRRGSDGGAGGGRGAEQRQHGTFRCAGCLRRRTGRAGCGQRQPGAAGGPGQRGGGFDGGAEHGRGGAKRLHLRSPPRGRRRRMRSRLRRQTAATTRCIRPMPRRTRLGCRPGAPTRRLRKPSGRLRKTWRPRPKIWKTRAPAMRSRSWRSRSRTAPSPQVRPAPSLR